MRQSNYKVSIMAGVKGRSGGARPGSGGARPGAGRPRKIAPPKPAQSSYLVDCPCGEKFEQSTKGHKKTYCSTECKEKAKTVRFLAAVKHKRAASPKVCNPVTCALDGCECVFVPSHQSIKYCTEQHKKVATQQFARAVGERIRARDRSERPCKLCGNHFTPEYGDLRRTYCSAKCMKKGCQGEGSNGHRARALKYGVRYERINKASVFSECGWQCQLCGIDTPPDLMGTYEKAAPTLDHIIPFARGGEHVRSNVHLACRGCNASKGSKLGWSPKG